MFKIYFLSHMLHMCMNNENSEIELENLWNVVREKNNVFQGSQFDTIQY